MRNFIVLTGNLTRDPELKRIKDTDIATFSIGVYKSKDKSFFVNIQAFNKQANFCSEQLKKGDKVEIVGRLDITPYEKDGKKMSYTVVTCDRFDIINKKQNAPKPVSNDDNEEEEF